MGAEADHGASVLLVGPLQASFSGMVSLWSQQCVGEGALTHSVEEETEAQ